MAKTSKGKEKEQAAEPKAKPATGKKLSSKERLVYNACLELSQSDKAITQDHLTAAVSDLGLEEQLEVCNSLARKRLLRLLQDRDTIAWEVVEIKAAQFSSSLSDECNLVLELIKASEDKGVWQKTLKTKSGLADAVMLKCIKTLQGAKLVKEVKSIKYPTRKMFFLESVTPSVEVTGGPWYSGSELDLEFIGGMKKLCLRLIKQECPDDLYFPESHAPFLPNSHTIAQQVASSDLTTIKLSAAHIEELLEVLLMDGEIERLRIRRPEGDYDTPEEILANAKKRKKARGSSQNGRKKKRARFDGDDSDESMNGFIEHDSSDEEGQDDFEGSSRLSSERSSRPGPPDRNKYYYVYRPVRKPDHLAYNLGIGYSDAPCGVCPVASACDNRSKPAAQDRPLNAAAGSVALHSTQSSKLSLEAQMELRLKLKAPGSSTAEEAGPWRGGGTRGKQNVGLVNPRDCVYYSKWLGEA